MKLERWALIAEIIGGIAIVVSVVLLLVEVRGNTEALRSASAQSITDAATDVLLLLASDGELSSLRVTGDTDVSTLSEDDWWRYFFYYRQHWLRFQNMYFQASSGVLETGTWDTYAKVICFDITDPNRPGVRTSWPDHASILDPEFVDMVESCPGFE